MNFDKKKDIEIEETSSFVIFKNIPIEFVHSIKELPLTIFYWDGQAKDNFLMQKFGPTPTSLNIFNVIKDMDDIPDDDSDIEVSFNIYCYKNKE